MIEINWFDLPFDHSGRWQKKFDSIIAPQEKVTFPQLIAEFVIYWRIQFLKDYKNLPRCKGWSQNIQGVVRKLNQQAAILCDYFPHPDDDSLVIVAFKNYFRKNKPLKIGQYRKTRYTTEGDRKVGNITQDEKDVVTGIMCEFDRLLKQRNSFALAKPIEIKTDVTFQTHAPTGAKKGSLQQLLDLERKIKDQGLE